MKLDLTNQKNSEIKYRISPFPDGQQTVDLVIDSLYGSIVHETVIIKSRLNNFKDLELIICANQALKNVGANRITLFVPYFIGARSDRKFQDGGVNYLKQVICPIINSQNFESVIVLDPHSDVLEACLNNYHKKNNFKLVEFALTKIDNKNGAQDRICLVSPDAGAYKKIFDVAKHFKIDNIVTATKVRDLKTGNILKTEIPNLPIDNDELKYVIIDDIGDGFGTFIHLSKTIKDIKPTAKVFLVVTHSIQENGIKNALEHIDGIFTTNSVGEFNIENVKVLNVF